MSAALLAGCGTDNASTDAADLLIRNVTVISARQAPVARDVFVRGGTIIAIDDPVPDHDIPPATVLDGTGKYLAPGLIDSHTHLGEIPGMTFELEQQYPAIAAEARLQIPRSYLYHGFTTVIDLNSHPSPIAEWNAQAVRPQAWFCGAAPVFDGYPMSFMPAPARYELMPYYLFDESRADDFPEGVDALLHTPVAIAGRIRADGAICVKTHYEKGFGGRGNLPVPTIELVQDLVAAAHDNGLPVLLHANSESAQSFGAETGVDAFAHGMWTWNDRTLTEMHDDIVGIVDATIENDIALQPTIQVLYGEQDMFDPDYLDDPRLKRVVPSSLIDWYRTEDGQWWRQRMLGIPIVARLVEDGLWEELDAPPIARVSAVLRYFASNGGTLLFGSDTPSDPTFANPPGLNGRLEMNRWIAAGVTPAQLFEAATTNNARFFGLDHEIGAIEVGKRADLLLLGASPLDDVDAYDSIEYVILGGRVIERASLSALSD